MHWRGGLVSAAFVYVAGNVFVLRIVEFLIYVLPGMRLFKGCVCVHVCVTVPVACFSPNLFVHIAWMRKDSITMSVMWIVLLKSANSE